MVRQHQQKTATLSASQFDFFASTLNKSGVLCFASNLNFWPLNGKCNLSFSFWTIWIKCYLVLNCEKSTQNNYNVKIADSVWPGCLREIIKCAKSASTLNTSFISCYTGVNFIEWCFPYLHPSLSMTVILLLTDVYKLKVFDVTITMF
jgi:hypothetical protein